MEHEVNVPFPVGSVRAALAEPARVARCVPGLQLDGAEGAESAQGEKGARAGAGSGAKDAKDAKSTKGAAAKGAAGTTEGRLRVRVGGSTITYRGSLTVTPRGEEFTVKASGTEARGTGSVRLNLTVVPRRATEGEATRLVCSGTVKGDGRIKDVEAKTATAAGHRLLERFAKALGESIREQPPETLDAPQAPATEPTTDAPSATDKTAGGIGEPGDNDRVIPGIPAPDSRESRTSAGASANDTTANGTTGESTGDTSEETSGDASDGTAEGTDGTARPADEARDEGDARPAAEQPDQTPEQGGKEESGEGESGEAESGERGGIFDADVPPSSLDPLQEEPLDESEVEAAAEAEAAHARRTMIGRSAEEVDHAPPRGRYAPIPVPEPIANSAALRWVAPAAAAVVAGAVFIGRALRRRR
ncbi:hypothetical protein K378_02878 [Streptomyces sp. Amel2xB2]|uniref:hypothetical protein n=1 Tax=Streptomyces sp. Amel2xB2 TaxID=1305829 RepID=UPI000DBA077F|nr:hypothetical protein [Streptomyces sp. Amel2xB2]RAJ66705.1 hypothetical protein K378_02878 [Streptomyces sp. Amel2xB2]